MGSGTLRASCQFKACGFHGRRLCDAVYMSSSLFVCRFPFLLYIYIFRVSFNIIPSREINQLKVYRLSSSNKPRFLFFALCLSSAMLAEQKRRSFLEILQMQLLFPSFKTAINTQNIYSYIRLVITYCPPSNQIQKSLDRCYSK